jgi:putative transposase
VHAVLDRHHLVRQRRRRRRRAAGTALSRPSQPNALWCADYKGEFLLGNRRYCYPLTSTDFASRYQLTCEALLTTHENFALTVFERIFYNTDRPHDDCGQHDELLYRSAASETRRRRSAVLLCTPAQAIYA